MRLSLIVGLVLLVVAAFLLHSAGGRRVDNPKPPRFRPTLGPQIPQRLRANMPKKGRGDVRMLLSKPRRRVVQPQPTKVISPFVGPLNEVEIRPKRDVSNYPNASIGVVDFEI